MAYASFDEALKCYDEASLAALCGELAEYGGDFDMAKVKARMEQALSDASCEIDMYLARRYKTPLPKTPQLLEACIDLAVWRLPMGAAEHSETIKDKCKFWRKSLEQVAEGKLSLPEGEEIDGYHKNYDLPLIEEDVSIFNFQNMKGF